MSTIGNVAVRDNAGAEAGVRRRLHFVDGANIAITTVDDPLNHEIVVTIVAFAEGSGADFSQFFPAPNPDGNKGTYASVVMPDDYVTTVRQTFIVPKDITAITTAAVVVIPDGTGNLRRSATTNFGLLCAGEQYDANTDAIAVGQIAVTDGEIECINFLPALTVATAEDIVGIEFTRDALDALDTVGASVHYLGVWIKGT